MSRFTTPLVARADDNELLGLWYLERPLVYESDLLARTVTVPIGFATDYASVPRAPFLYFAEGGKGNKAAVVHDYLYSVGPSGGITREIADQVLREALVASGYSAFTASLFYAAVRFGGQSHWTQDNNAQPDDVTANMLDFATSLRAGA